MEPSTGPQTDNTSDRTPAKRPDSGPDYSHYSLEQLQRARRSIDTERFPERTERLEQLIRERAARGDSEHVHAEPHVRPLAYSELRGSPWLRRVIAVVTIWGGATGAISLLVGIAQSTHLLTTLLSLALAGFYSWLCWAGVLLMEDRPGAVHHNQTLWGLQIPIFLSPWVSYLQANGAVAALWIQLNAFSFGFNLHLGTQTRLQFGTTESSISIGVNFFAVAIIGLLVALEDSRDALPAAPQNQLPNAVGSET